MWEQLWEQSTVPLTARHVANAKPGRYTDSRGLILLVKESGARSWLLRYQINGRRRDMGLGAWPDVSLAAARQKAHETRRLIAEKQDPLSERKRASKLLFEDAAEALIESKRGGWKNAKHAAQWSSTLRTYVYPALRDIDVRDVGTQEVLAVLKPIWRAKTETASRLRQRIEAVLDYAAALGARERENPARWRGHLDHLLPRPRNVQAVKHYSALDWRDAPAFMQELRDREGMAAQALAFLILTAARSGEVRGSEWTETDIKDGVWTVPASRMKAGKEHRVPLSKAAIDCLPPVGTETNLVFPGQGAKDGPLSDMTLSAVLKRMGRTDITVHGFRSTFRDWAGETTNFPREVIETALAHRLKDKAEAAYARGDLFAKRRHLMKAWADFLLPNDS